MRIRPKCSTHGEMRNSDNRSIKKSEDEMQFRRPAHGWKNDVQVDFREKFVDVWVGCCAQDGEPSRVVQAFDQLSHFRRFKKDCLLKLI